MTDLLHVDAANLVAILVMTAVTYATRVSGLVAAGWIPATGAMRRALDALPPAVLVAVVAPTLVDGPAEALAGVLVLIAAFRLPAIAVVALGVVAVAVLRQMGL